ncbi:vacuolar carboxypeptidase-like protein Cps1 [Byssothecium circinans]|uniref:Vacuolar carboxypeptidase-like protein Cps1 n=1 Tax=Byssothecium circinans TaxID=147558 RepID=A0A6A5TWW3_9PLEO|nr:vacuolar carboxypeptidase-like protein Cps1 [Byssothecium circinans]
MAKNWGKQTFIEVPHLGTTPKRVPWRRLTIFLLATIFLLRNYIVDLTSTAHHQPAQKTPSTSQKCPQVSPLYPKRSTKELDEIDDYLQSSAFRNKTIERLAGAVRVPTQSYDDLGPVGVDPRWDIFYSFADYLSNTFPLVHATLQLEKVNTHALLYTWAGTDPSLKPTVLMAHQDVVPVPDSTVGSWTHPPFSGHFDGTFIWGRGSSDCKNQLIGILEAVETLIQAGFSPQRTLVLSFGFDEEISGQEGARHLSDTLVKKYGHHGVAVIIDEGAANLENWGAEWAIPGVAEKGYVDVDITVRMPGGHSSIPPKHNGIGVASDLITLIESSPYEPYLDEENPYLSLLYCGAEHAPDFPKPLKKLLHKREKKHSHTCTKKSKKDHLALEAAKAGPAIKYLFTTSVAVDLISGGVKTNALPERTAFTVNHRINVGSSSKAVFNHITSLAAQIARKYNLTLTPFNGTESPSSITLRARDTLLEPAPVTPTFLSSQSSTSHSGVSDLTPYEVLSGTTRALYSDSLFVAPGIMTGNTDTRYYWDLSEHIFRYGPGWDREQDGLGNIHTVDERIGIKGHVDGVRWFVGFLRNVDEARL